MDSIDYQTISYFSSTGIELTRATPGSSGFDLRAVLTEPVDLMGSGGRHLFPTGVYLEMPRGVEAQIRPRSGMAARNGVVAMLGTIDSDYRGELIVNLMNLGTRDIEIKPGDRIAQLVFAPTLVFGVPIRQIVYSLKQQASLGALNKTTRGTDGFGSTGV